MSSICFTMQYNTEHRYHYTVLVVYMVLRYGTITKYSGFETEHWYHYNRVYEVYVIGMSVECNSFHF